MKTFRFTFGFRRIRLVVHLREACGSVALFLLGLESCRWSLFGANNMGLV